MTTNAVTSKAMRSGAAGPDSVSPDVAGPNVMDAGAQPTGANAMQTYAALILRSLARARVLIGAMCLLLVAFQVALVVQANAQFEDQAFARMGELMPAFVRRTLGDLTAAILSFEGVVTAAYFHPVIVLIVAHVAIYLGSEPAHDVEAGLVDLLLARPVPRHALITRSLVLIAIGTLVVSFTLAGTMWGALHLLAPDDAPWPAAGVVIAMTVNLTFVSACFGALALLIASRVRRRGIAIAAGSVLSVLMYLIVFLEATWAPARAIGWLSPFHYFHPIGILAGRVEVWRDLLILGSAIAGLGAAAYWTFHRRDL